MAFPKGWPLEKTTSNAGWVLHGRQGLFKGTEEMGRGVGCLSLGIRGIPYAVTPSQHRAEKELASLPVCP